MKIKKKTVCFQHDLINTLKVYASSMTTYALQSKKIHISGEKQFGSRMMACVILNCRKHARSTSQNEDWEGDSVDFSLQGCGLF